MKSLICLSLFTFCNSKFQVRIAAPSRCESRGRYLYADYQQIIFIIKGTTEKLFHSPQSSPKPKACRASYDAVPIRLLAYPNTPVVSRDFLGLPEANPRVRLHFKKNRYSYFNLKHETNIRIVFFLHLVSTNCCKRHSGDLNPPVCEVHLWLCF